MKLYYYPLRPGANKFYNSPTDSFWCCTGTGAEEFARFNDNIYFHDDNDLYVNLYVPSELNWAQRRVSLRQETRFPREPRTRLTLKLAHPQQFALHLRIPSWIGAGAKLHVNGQIQDMFASPGSYLSVQREWRDGDQVELELPMQLHALPLPGDDSQIAMLYGPLVLAARLGRQGLTHAMQYGGYATGPEPKPPAEPAPRISAASPNSTDWMRVVSTDPLSFEATTRQGALAVAPLNEIDGERYAVYWQNDNDLAAEA
jgi:DUF1680 family protein